MKLKSKIAAVIAAAAVFAGTAVPAAYATSEPPSTTAPTEAPSGSETPSSSDTTSSPDTNKPTYPYLGSGAFSGGYTCSNQNVEKGKSCTIYAVTYIPIENFDYSVTADDFGSCNIFAVTGNSDSFSFYTTNAWNYTYKLVGSFLCVTSEFGGVTYLGGDSNFTYNICYTSASNSVNLPITINIAECKEVPEEEEVTAIFTLADSGSYSIKAGSEATVNIRLKSVNSGSFTSVNASLSSSDSSVVVKETGAKSSYSPSPSFSFRVSVPQTTPAGTYNLSLSTYVYGKDGTLASQESYTIPVMVTSDVVSSGLSVSGYKVSKEPVKAGESFSLSLTLENKCGLDLKDVKVSLDGLDSSKFVLDGGFSSKSVNISSGKKETVTFPLVACSGISNVRESIPVKAEYKINPADASTAQSLSTSVIVECSLEDIQQAISSGLVVSSYDISREPIKPGESFKLSLTLENKCNVDLSDVKVSLPGLDSSKFVLDGGFSSQSVSIKAGKKGKVTFPLVACAGIASVRESIPVQAEYRIKPLDASSVQTLSTSVIAECAPEGEKQEVGKYDVTMTDYSFSSNAVMSGTKFKLNFTLKNSSDSDINGARVSVMELNGSKFAIDSGLTYANFDLKAGASKSFTFPLVGCDGISSIREVIPIEISFGQQTSTAYATVTCNVPEGGSDGQTFAPAIIIESYDFGGEFVTGGNTFPLNLTIKNTGASSAIENLKVTIMGGAGNGDNGVAFSPANSSNSFFIETLPARSTTDIKIDLLPRADANPDSYPVIVTFDYEYIANGKRAKAETITETITIPLQQEDRFTINQPDYPESIGIGEMGYVSVSFINKGKSGVYNVTADIEGEGFEKSTGAYYIGNVASGSEEYYDVQITPNMEGQVTAEIVVTYEDANGTQKEQRVPITMNVISYEWSDTGVDFEDPGMMGEDMAMTEEEGNLTWLWFTIGGAVVVIVAIIIIVAVVKKKKKKKLESEDEDI